MYSTAALKKRQVTYAFAMLRLNAGSLVLSRVAACSYALIAYSGSQIVMNASPSAAHDLVSLISRASSW